MGGAGGPTALQLTHFQEHLLRAVDAKGRGRTIARRERGTCAMARARGAIGTVHHGLHARSLLR
eukprot:554276-Pyramimonas_sp.AAC.1